MKFTLVLLILAVFASCALSCTDDSWVQYKSTYNKNYPDPSEDLRHHDIYCDKLKIINEHNAKYVKGETTFEMGVNRLTDLSAQEMTQWIG